jgi:hypothetical protein
MKPSLLVMAAGMGSRYGGLKQVEPFGPGGETLLDYSVFDALRAGFGQVVFIIRRDFENVFRERVGARFEKRIAVEYVFQELARLPGGRTPPPTREKPWGTGHAVWCAAGACDGPFVAINADDFYGRDAFAQMAAYFAREKTGNSTEEKPARFAMAGYRLADTLSEHGTVSRGVCRVDARGKLVAIEEVSGIAAAADGGGGGRVRAAADGSERALAPDTIVSMNCWGFSPAIFPLLERGLADFLDARGGDPKAEFYLPSAVAAAIDAHEAGVEVLPVRATWFGVTHRDDKPRVVEALGKLVAGGEYPGRLWS